jgi:CheY-like chemotaxis protein
MLPKALVVDNDFFFVEFLSDLLVGRGYQVVKAYDGKEAIECLQRESFDIVFVDMLMPKIDGGKVIEYARALFVAPRFPIVALSGAIIERVDELGELDADYFIAKGPLEEMEVEINRFLSGFERPGNDHEKFDGFDKFFEPAGLHPRQETAELIDAMEFQKDIVESIPTGVLVLDSDTRLIHANSEALRILGLKIEGLLNKPLTSLFIDEEKTLLVSALKKSVAGGQHGWISVTPRNMPVRLSLKPGVLKANRNTAGWVLLVEGERHG